MGLGETLQPALQSFVAFATGSQRNTRVSIILGVADTAAKLVAGPMTAALMAIGRTDNHPSDGLCFLASSVCFSSSVVLLLLSRHQVVACPQIFFFSFFFFFLVGNLAGKKFT